MMEVGKKEQRRGWGTQGLKTWAFIRKHGWKEKPVARGKSHCKREEPLQEGPFGCSGTWMGWGVYKLMVCIFHLPVLILWFLPCCYQPNAYSHTLQSNTLHERHVVIYCGGGGEGEGEEPLELFLRGT